MISTSLVEPRETDKEHVAGGNCGTAPLGVRVSQRAVSHVPVAASFPTCPCLLSPWRQVFQLVRESRLPLVRARLSRTAGTAKLPSLGASDLPPQAAWHAQQVGHPPRLLQLRRSQLLMSPWRQVSQLVRVPCPRGGKFPNLSVPPVPVPVAASFQLVRAPCPRGGEFSTCP
jgi:hypothetical protein